MPTRPISTIIEHICRTVLRDEAEHTDGELLGCFLERRDEAAFAALVKRHSPMVWRVCNRHLNYHDAKDAFQATFLVLVRKAASILPKEMVGNWLYGVAYQTVLHAQRTAARRKVRELQVTVMPDTEARQQEQALDLLPLLDQELSRLPENYRAVIVLCDLEDRTRKEAARQLGVPEGTVAGRLARARAMLAKRLGRRGVTLSLGALAAELARNASSADVPTDVVLSAIEVATNRAGVVGAISGKVAALTEGVLKTMFLEKLKVFAAIVLVLGFFTIGTTIVFCRLAAAEGNRPAAAEEPPITPGNQTAVLDNESFTAWGKEIDGLQAGLGFRRGEKRAYRYGEPVTIVARIRNNTEQDIEFKHIWAFFVENPPTITDPKGNIVELLKSRAEGLQAPRTTNVPAGKEVNLYEWGIDIDKGWAKSHQTGTFTLRLDPFVGPTSGNPNHPNPAMAKLATGKLKLEIKSDAAPAPDTKTEGDQKQLEIPREDSRGVDEKTSLADDKSPKPDLKPFLEQVRKLVEKHYPKAVVTLKDETTIHFEFNTRKFMIHEPTLTGEWQDAHEQVGPQKKGIYGNIELRAGQYMGQIALPQSIDKLYFIRFLTISRYSKKLDRHLFIDLKHPRAGDNLKLHFRDDVSNEFLKELEQLVNDFEKYF